MAKGIALTVGLNAVDPAHYGWDGPLKGCEADARDMAAIATAQGFVVSSLLTQEATREHVQRALRDAAGALTAGDIFLLCYSGHGGQLPDLNGDEDDGQDETWCLYDGQLVDDEMNLLLAAFAKGVRVLVTADSCHSGTSVKMAFTEGRSISSGVRASASDGRRLDTYRCMPSDVATSTYLANRDFYDPILSGDAQAAGATPSADVMLISGCQDNQYARDGLFNGLFTGTLKRIWNGGKFAGSYPDFWKAIGRAMPQEQSPNYFWSTPPNPAFEQQKPFTI